jgi:probable phosphoglycerate mutase
MGWGFDRVAPGRKFMLTTASLSAVGYEHSLTRPVIRLWNDDRHVGD